MGLIELVLTLMAVGVVLWLIETYVPMAAPIKTVIRVVVVVVVVLWLLRLLAGDIPLPTFR